MRGDGELAQAASRTRSKIHLIAALSQDEVNFQLSAVTPTALLAQSLKPVA